MKLRKFELSLLAIAIAAAFFTAGYFCGRGRAGDVNVTVTRSADAPADTQAGGDLIDLNTATRWELTALPGVGEALADRILAYRTENGRFGSVEELMDVRGIGESLYDSIKDYLTV